MPFENFYKEANQYAHRLRLCLLAAGLFIAAYFGLPVFVSWLLSPPAPPPAPELLSKETAGRYAAELCANLPQPEGLSLSGASNPLHTNESATVIYTYYSERNYEEVLPLFLIRFDEENWERVFDEVGAYRNSPGSVFNFRKGNQRVSVYYFNLPKTVGALGKVHYEIACTVERFQPRD